MVLAKVKTKYAAEPVVSLYLPMLTEYLPPKALLMVLDVKKMAVAMGGKRNASGRFLRRGYTDTVVVTANSTPCKGVLQIPRKNDICDKLLVQLDSCKCCFRLEVCFMCSFVHFSMLSQ